MKWDQQYFQKIIDRTNDRIENLGELDSRVGPGNQLPVSQQVTIGGGKQLQAAILFIDISGYSGWNSGTHEDQKQVLSRMNIFMAEMMNIVRDHDGLFEKNTGDGLMAYFVDRSEAEPDAQVAVNAALTMHYFNDNLLTPALVKEGAAPVAFRIGIDCGPITVAKVGVPGGLNSFVAIGASANIACKLLNLGDPGEIILGSHVRDRLPAPYQQWCRFMLNPTGFVVGPKQQPYFAYKYVARRSLPEA